MRCTLLCELLARQITWNQYPRIYGSLGANQTPPSGRELKPQGYFNIGGSVYWNVITTHQRPLLMIETSILSIVPGLFGGQPVYCFGFL